MENYELTLAELIRIGKKRKWIIGFSFLAVYCATVVFTNMRPEVYQATVKLMIERNEDRSGTLVWDVEPNLSTEVQVIKSFQIMRKVVERTEKVTGDAAAREQALVNLAFEYQNSIEVEQIEASNIITITVKANKARKAVLIANTIADVYIEEDVEGRKVEAQAVLEYVDKEIASQRAQILENEARLHAFKQDERVFFVTSEKMTTLNRMTVKQAFAFERDIFDIDNRIKELDTQLEGRQGSDLIAWLNAGDLQNDLLFLGLNRRLLELEFECFLLLIDYTREHPVVRGKESEIEEAKQRMNTFIQDISGMKYNDGMKQDLTLFVNKLFLNAQREVLFRIINKSYEESGSLSSDQLKYLELKRETDNALSAYERLLAQKESSTLSLVREIATITIVSPATAPKAPISPNKGVNYMIGVLVGALFAIMVGFAVENIDASISTIEDVEKNIGLSVLGTVPFIQGKKAYGFLGLTRSKELEQRSRLISIYDPKACEIESIKTLRTHIIQVMRKENKKVMLFSSALQQEGKSAIAANMAVLLAGLGMKTLLLDANLRRPTVYKFFGVNRKPGLSDILLGKIPWQEAVRNAADFIVGSLDVDKLLDLQGLDNLRIITSGTKIPNPAELLHHIFMDRLLIDLRGAYDAVIIDCPPVLPVTDTLSLANKVDGVVVVYRVAKTKRDMLRRAKGQLENVGADICGVILNDIKKEEQLGAAAYHYKYQYDEMSAGKSGVISQSLSKLSSIFI